MPVLGDAACVVPEGAGELFAELEAGAEETDFDVGFAQAECIGGLFYGQTFDIAQQENHSVAFVKFSQRVIDQAGGFVALGELFG